MNDAHLSQTADRAKTRQPGLLVKVRSRSNGASPKTL